MAKKLKLIGLVRKERGYTLLEYCAGAAVLAGIVYGGLQFFGTSLAGFFTGLGNWVTSQSVDSSS